MIWDSKIYNRFGWCRPISSREEKQKFGRMAAQKAKSGQVIGIGTGSSSYVALCEIARRAREEGLDISIVPAAREIALAAASLGVRAVSLNAARPDWCVDGADEIGSNGDVIKGRGAGLFMEKLIIASSDERYIIAENAKFVDKVGAKPIPVEVFPDALCLVERGLAGLGAVEAELRLAQMKDGPVITEAGNLILDCRFPEVEPGLEKELKALPGVIESGLFQGCGFKFFDR